MTIGEGAFDHDEDPRIEERLGQVAARCSEKRVQFTDIRRRILRIQLREGKAIGAYGILDRLKTGGVATHPPMAYRSLDFLVKHNFAHKIEHLNAFVACTHPCEDHAPAFVICRKCHKVSEAVPGPMGRSLRKAARDNGLHVELTVMEAIGICPDCQEQTPIP